MKLPPLVYALGYAGLIPFLAGPVWLSFAPQSAPPWLDHLWLLYAAMIASFMSGTFWGMSLLVAEGPNGMIGMAMSAVLFLLSWGALALPFRLCLFALAGVFVLLVAAEVWRERTIDPLSGYFTLRASLTIGVLLTIAWRVILGV
ncbi:MAG: DUF3429 domain-containing protein [Nevskia sp.]|nr:DUF3429 domain-containing protein [Nevskia sp.]